MYLVLLFVGLVVAAAGVALLGYAVPVEDLAGAALFVSGVTAIVAALTIGAIAAAVRVLSRIAERLEIQPLPLPPVAAVGREDPVPRPVRAVHAAGAAGAAAARPSLLGWLGGGESRVPVRAARAPSPAKPEPEPAAPPPVDLAPLTRIPASSPSSPPSPSSPSSPMANPNGAAATVYRSGVIDGMAYSLFMDGSIEAELPIGRVKFATIDELQQYLEKKK
jgi:hypothetical protein